MALIRGFVPGSAVVDVSDSVASSLVREGVAEFVTETTDAKPNPTKDASLVEPEEKVEEPKPTPKPVTRKRTQTKSAGRTRTTTK